MAAPLARDRFGRPVELPQDAAGFVVYRVPSERGGAPRIVEDGGYPLEIELETSEERLLELVGRAGRYRLDVVDGDGRPLNVSCWVKLKPSEGQSPAPQSLTEATVAEATRAVIEMARLMAESNRDLASANARMAAGVRRPFAPAIDEDEEPAQFRQLVERAIQAGGGEPEKELSPEEHIKRAQVAKAYADVLFGTLAEHGPKALQFFQFLKSAVGEPKPPLPGGTNGVT